MTLQQMKTLKAGDILLDSQASTKAKQPITCYVIDTQDDGILVTGYGSQSKGWYDSGGELLEWSEATVLEKVDEDRVNESGYLV